MSYTFLAFLAAGVVLALVAVLLWEIRVTRPVRPSQFLDRTPQRRWRPSVIASIPSPSTLRLRDPN